MRASGTANGGRSHWWRRRRRSSQPLTEIGRRHQAEKSELRTKGGRPLTEIYEVYLSPWREEPITLLEIGIKRGGSLRLWHDYFPRARIFALDIRDCGKHLPESERVHAFIGDQSDPQVLRTMVAQSGPLDLVVDDGSHQAEDQRASLLSLWPHLRPGGLYAIEDIQTSYRMGDGRISYRDSGSTIEMLKELVDDIHARRHGRGSTLNSLSAVHFEHRVALLRKGES